MRVLDFLRGMGSVLDLYGPERTVCDWSLHARSDIDPLARDWERVGDDFYDGLRDALGASSVKVHKSKTADGVQLTFQFCGAEAGPFREALRRVTDDLRLASGSGCRGLFAPHSSEPFASDWRIR